MNIRELVKALMEHDMEREVKITWEGIDCSLEAPNIYIHKKTGALFLDGDENRYKAEFTSGKK